MVEQKLPKLTTGVRFPSPAPKKVNNLTCIFLPSMAPYRFDAEKRVRISVASGKLQSCAQTRWQAGHRYMRIFESPPAKWSELEQRVCQILQGCGLSAERGVSVNILRGKRKVDVMATKAGPPKILIICECKYWNSNVDQQTVDAFANVVTNSGASKGYIISKKGFQKGAFLAAKNTSIELMTYNEFEAEFHDAWLSYQTAYFREHIPLAWDFIDRYEPNGPQNNFKPHVIWRRSEIFKQAGWVSGNGEIDSIYFGVQPGNYRGRDRQITIRTQKAYFDCLHQGLAWLAVEMNKWVKRDQKKTGFDKLRQPE